MLVPVAVERSPSYAPVIGRGLSTLEVQRAARALREASPHKDFDRHQDVSFVYEKLDGADVRDAVKDVVDRWIQVSLSSVKMSVTEQTKYPENIQRAASVAGRGRVVGTGDLVHQFCGFRFRPLKRPSMRLQGLATDHRLDSTVAIIALTPLTSSNGSFIELAEGEDVCLDGHSTIVLPGTGGGIGVLIDLKI